MTQRWDVAAVLLDMDGTLLDTERVYMASLVAALEGAGYPDATDICHAMIGIPGPECEVMLRAHYGNNFPLADINKTFMVNCEEMMRDGVPLKRGTIALLDALHAAAWPMAIVTSSSRRAAESHLARAGIRERFATLVTRDDVARGKPFPDLYLLAAETLGVAPQRCVAVEDSNPGVAAAHAAGMIALMVPDLLPPHIETVARCCAVLPDLDSVLDLLRARTDMNQQSAG